MRVALAGNPNCGKTTLFNALTGSTAHVGNWPGVTVDRKQGKYKGLSEDIEVIDLPGIYSLSAYSPEELVARNYILHEKPDVIINIIDATNLERNLYLTTQLLETDIPVLAAVNMIDLLEKGHMTIDMQVLEAELGIPAVEISAIKNQGLKPMMEKAVEIAKDGRKGCSVLSVSSFGVKFDEMVNILKANNINHAYFRTVKILEENERNPHLDEETKRQVFSIKDSIILDEIFEGDFEAAIADWRYKYITSNYKKSVTYTRGHDYKTYSDKIDTVLTHKWFGIPIFFFIMFLCFHLTFSDNMFFITGLPSPGVFLVGVFEVVIDFLTNGMANFLVSAGIDSSSWIYGLIINGVFAGVGSVLTFIPLIMILFLFLSIMEDSGYMARGAFLMDRLLRKFGVSGKAFLPLLMGFGCSVPAIAATRTLENENEKKITIMLMTGFSCGAKLPLWTVFAAAFFPQDSDLMVFGIYVAGVVFACIFGFILKKFFFKSEASPFIMELPAYHMPQARNIFIHLWEKVKDYVTRAATVIAGSTVVIWLLSNFNFSMQMVEENSHGSMLGTIGSIIQPLFVPLGFALDIVNGWKNIVAIFTGGVAKEMVVATLGVLYGDAGGSGGSLASALGSIFTTPAAISFMLFNLLSVPCMAAVASARAELKSNKWMLIVVCYWFASAYIVSFLVYQIGTLLGF